MLRRSLWVSAMMLAGSGLLMMSGCAEQGPKPGGVTTVSPPTKPGTAPTAPTDKPAEDKAEEKTEEKKAGDEKPAEPAADAGSTTGGGTETPSTPGNGQ